jgi:hypothetical protein
MTLPIDLKQWFLFLTVCLLGWVFGFALYLIIGPEILQKVNLDSGHQQNVHSSVVAPQNNPAPGYLSEQPHIQDAVLHSTTPAHEVVERLLVLNKMDVRLTHYNRV